MTKNAKVAVTLGDPAGVGPEVIVKALAAMPAGERKDFVIVGNTEALVRADCATGTSLRFGPTASEDGSTIAVDEVELGAPLPEIGKVSPVAGDASVKYISRAVDLAMSGEADVIVTAPINKEAMASAGIRYPGHTEILADYGGAKRVAMMLANDDIRTVLVTIHTSLRKAIDEADFDAQMSAIRLANEGGKALGIEAPRVAVAGLNPHAGEGGLFGDEEIRIIGPAIEAARAEGIDASGPWPGDTVYMQARKGRFDVVVAQYHDQGLIPVKYLGLEKGVNITLGLPFVRTSPDHGTAFDIAGRGIADTASLETALAYARRLVAAQIKTKEGVV
jgi:4-hydroxythreonine-4-phosphate dehydrogenase